VLDDLSVERREERWAGLLGDPHPEESVWVAEEDGRVVGFASTGLNRDEDLGDDPPPEVFAIYLVPDLWGRGIGRELESRALEDLAGRGFKHVVMWVLEGNERAVRFYAKSGWQPDGAREFLEGLDAYKVRYRRPLGLAP
jgi:GNAT superfamily N-acetyltransferase